MAIVHPRRWPKWIPAILGVVVFGFVATLAVASKLFEAQSEREVEKLFAQAQSAPVGVLTREELAGLPAAVRGWVEASGAVGRERARTVRLMQRGQMRTARDAPWSAVDAHQYFATQPPGFVWLLSAMMRGLPVSGRDHYLDGKGRMLITLGSLVKVADAQDEKIAQGAMLRYLGEIIWFPSAAVQPYLSWEEIDERSARATITWAGLSAPGVFHFDDQHRFIAMAADRYFYRDTGSTLEKWEVTADAWSSIRGITMPTRGEAHWKLADGDLSYYRWEILDVEVNNPQLYVPGDAPHPERAPLPSPVAAAAP